MMPNLKSIFPLTLALLLLLPMIIVPPNLSTEVQARPLASFNPQLSSQPRSPDNQSSDDEENHEDDDDDDDDGGEDNNGKNDDDDDDDDDDGGGDNGGDEQDEQDNKGEDDDDDDSGEDNGGDGQDEQDNEDEDDDDNDSGGDGQGEKDNEGEDDDDNNDSGGGNDGAGQDEEKENTPQPSSLDNKPPDDDAQESEPTDYVIVKIDRCDLTCSAFKEQTIELLAQVQLVHEGSGFTVKGVISNLKSTRFSVPYPGKWKVYLTAQPKIVSAQPVDDPKLQAALAASFRGAPVLMGTLETNTSSPQLVKCPLICNVHGLALSSSDPGPASDRGVQPASFDGNPQDGPFLTNCGFFNSNYQELRLEPVDSGHYTDGFLSLDIVVTLSNPNGPSFDWSIAADSLIDALPGIFVKGGNGGNWYDYNGFMDLPAGGATFDGSLHSPINPQNGKFSGLSHISFCYQITPQGGNRAGNSNTNTSQDRNGGGDTHRFNNLIWNQGRLDSGAAEVTDNINPFYLPETGLAQSRNNSLIAAFLIISGFSLTVVGLFLDFHKRVLTIFNRRYTLRYE